MEQPKEESNMVDGVTGDCVSPASCPRSGEVCAPVYRHRQIPSQYVSLRSVISLKLLLKRNNEIELKCILLLEKVHLFLNYGDSFAHWE